MTHSADRPWKRNLLRIPQNILEKVSKLPKDELVVACLRKIPRSHIERGTYAHIRILLDDAGQVVYPSQLVPSVSNGRFSRRNVEGQVVVRRDLPMVTRTFSVDTPNYGDWSLGSHEVSWDRNVYQREYIAPRELAILVEQIAEDVQADALVFRFTVQEVLDRRADGLGDRLLFNLNLLQENTGNHDVFPSDASLDDYLKTLYVNWELLPPGEREENIARIFRTLMTSDPKIRQQITHRYDYLARMSPMQFIRGTNGFRNYFGAQFAADLVVFENVEYGNAIYVMYADWTQLSQMSRTELLDQHPEKFVRIPHTANWEKRLRALISRERKERSRR